MEPMSLRFVCAPVNTRHMCGTKGTQAVRRKEERGSSAFNLKTITVPVSLSNHRSIREDACYIQPGCSLFFGPSFRPLTR